MQNQATTQQTHSIRTPLIAAFVLSVLLPAIVIDAFTAITTFQSAIERTRNQLQSVATLKVAQIETQLIEWLDELDVVARGISPSMVDWVGRSEDDVSGAFHQQLTDQVERLEQATRIFQKLYVLNLNGQIIAQVADDTPPPPFSQFKYIQNGSRSAGIEPVRYDQDAAASYVWFFQPIALGDEQVGILAGRMSLFRINLLMRERAGLGETGETYLVDANQVLVSPSLFEEYEVGSTRIDTDDLNQLIETHQGNSTGTTNTEAAVLSQILATRGAYSGEYLNYRGVDVVGVGRWIPRLELILIAEMEREEAAAGVQEAILFSIGVTAVAILIVVIISGWVVSRYFIAPLGQLAAAAGKIGDGSYKGTAVSQRKDELGTVARAFDDMSDKIRRQMEQLAHNEARFRSVIESLPLGLLLLTGDKASLKLEGVNAAAEKLFATKNADAAGKPLLDALPVLQQQAIYDHFQKTITSGHSWQGEVTSGDEAAPDMACEVYAFPTIPGRMVAAFVDIRERKLAEQERAQLQQQIIEAQREALKELSTPIIPLMSGVIIMPLIGSIDTARARDIMRALLAGISEHRAKVAILDITGVPLVDTGVATHLNGTMQAARLKGAHIIVTGVSDAVAETIVDLGIDWSHVQTLRDLESGLRAAAERVQKSTTGNRPRHNGKSKPHQPGSQQTTLASRNGTQSHT